MDTEVIYVNVPIGLKRSLEDLAMRNRQQGRGPRTLMGLVVQACDDLLTRDLPGYQSMRTVGGGQMTTARWMRSGATHVEQIMQGVAALVLKDGMDVFSRADIRERIGVERHIWDRSYSPTFQGMREDQPGGAPNVGARYKNIFRQVEHGRHTLTPYGRQLIKEFA